jgi:alkanesulfonate monooxygenase SsuD/methylene tetrahydromethanopterin reductase-like flavin-dependent oxidoreductase (luciferase family)
MTPINWSGKFRPSITNLHVFSATCSATAARLDCSRGTPQSVIRAATLGLPMALAIIGGTPDRFVPLIELYRKTAAKKNKEGEQKKVRINSHCFLADTSQEAADIFYPSYCPGHVEDRAGARLVRCELASSLTDAQ